MEYTAGELRKMNGRKCKLQHGSKPEAEGEIYVVDGLVSFVTNELPYNGSGEKKQGYEFSWLLHWASEPDSESTECYDSITFLDEPHQNIYYDDNGEIIKEGDLVLVGNNNEYYHKQTFLCKVPRLNIYYTENKKRDNIYNPWGNCIKYKDEKKPRNLMLTDEEYEEVTKKYQ